MADKKRAKPLLPAPRFSKAQGRIAKGLLLNLSGSERGVLLLCPRLRPLTRQKIDRAGEEAVRFTKNELNRILVEIGAGLDFAPTKFQKPLLTLRERVVDLLEQDAPDAFGAELLKGHSKTTTRNDLCFQFEIKLLNVDPPIWRRIQVQDCNLATLHVCIQAAFGWEDYHLHEFVIGGLRFGPCQPEGFLDLGLTTQDETEPRMSQLVPQSGKQSRWTYVYDFGDDWYHEIVFEGCAPVARGAKYPLCLDGARACPPEDIGGPWGYAESLEAIADPAHERHEELMEWLGPFDPEKFDAKQATREMRKWLRKMPDR